MAVATAGEQLEGCCSSHVAGRLSGTCDVFGRLLVLGYCWKSGAEEVLVVGCYKVTAAGGYPSSPFINHHTSP